MKRILIFILILQAGCCFAQTVMTADEKALRNADAIKTVFERIKANPVKNSLAKANEYVLFSFNTSNNKTVSLCIARYSSVTAGYVLYRFGTKNKVEFEYPADTVNSFSAFKYASYHRGGGKANACLDIDEVNFMNNGFQYQVSYNYSCEDEVQRTSINIINPAGNKTTTIYKKGKMTGYIGSVDGIFAVSDEY